MAPPKREVRGQVSSEVRLPAAVTGRHDDAGAWLLDGAGYLDLLRPERRSSAVAPGYRVRVDYRVELGKRRGDVAHCSLERDCMPSRFTITFANMRPTFSGHSVFSLAYGISLSVHA